ncbi:MAG TPA: S8 family serine peptidase [Elusimicrobiota bacterium]|nr:S8 family serine peptidase [Elusimicrobiota bacterium]
MKTLRSALAAGITLSLILLSPGGAAWAQVAEIAGRGVPTAVPGAAASAAGSIANAAGAAPLAPALTLTTLSPAFSAPSAFAPSAAAPMAAPASAAQAALPAAAHNLIPVAASAPSAGISAVAAAKAVGAPANAVLPSRAAAANAPAASALEGLRRELPDFSKLSVGDSKGAAAADFLSRVGELSHRAPALSAVPAAAGGMTRSGLSKSAKAGQPSEELDGAGHPVKREGAIDGLGNPARVGGEHGPDDHRTTEDDGRGGSGLFGALGVSGLAAASGVAFVQPFLTIPLVLISLVLHEIGHAKAAKALGDPTAFNQGRASFNPLTWAKHVDPVMTIVVPIVTYLSSGFIFGGAKPVPVDASYFKHPLRDMAKVAFAGPAVNLALAGLGALAYAGAVAAGLGTVVLGALTSFVFINALLAIFNLMPIPPLDGGHILMAFLPASVALKIQSLYARLGMLGMLPIAVIAVAGGGFIMAAAAALTHLLIGASFALTGVQLASAAMPAMAALGMAIGSLRGQPVAKLTAEAAPPSGPAAPGAASGGSNRPVDLVVLFSNEKSLTKDLHLSSVDSRSANYVSAYQAVQSSLLSQLDSVGLSPEALAAYEATPVASYRRINAATIRVDASRASEFEAALRAAGHKVYPNERRRIIIPAPVVPEGTDPASRNPVSMSENLRITGADAVQAIAQKRFGSPDMNPWQRVKKALGLEQPAQPAIGVVDSGADVSHPLLKRVKDVKNQTSGENVDDIGHGSWVTSMVLNYAPWSKNVTHYKTFLNGGATLDDILKSLTAAANDGNLVISNSWGSDDGDPESPDSVLVKKLASEGHVMVFAAGNAGPGANTVGSPAIVQYKDSETGAIRVLAVAATDRNKKVASFSSRGPGSPKTAGKDGFAHRPDLASLGANTEGAWPASLGDADRTDPELGSVKAISGTSMSTPSVAGALALLLIVFGITAKGAKLDAVVNAVMATVEKTGQGADNEGEGFLNVTAAYESLYKQFNPGQVPPTAIARYQRLKLDESTISDYLDPMSEANRVAGYPEDYIVERQIADLGKIHAGKAALEAEYPDIAHLSSGLIARAWARLTGRAPIPAHVAEYRRLSDKIRDNDARSKAYMAAAQHLSAGVREEMLEHYYETMAPEYDADRASLDVLLKQHPNADYEASGPFRRLFLRLTGRGPKS